MMVTIDNDACLVALYNIGPGHRWKAVGTFREQSFTCAGDSKAAAQENWELTAIASLSEQPWS